MHGSRFEGVDFLQRRRAGRVPISLQMGTLLFVHRHAVTRRTSASVDFALEAVCPKSARVSGFGDCRDG